MFSKEQLVKAVESVVGIVLAAPKKLIAHVIAAVHAVCSNSVTAKGISMAHNPTLEDIKSTIIPNEKLGGSVIFRVTSGTYSFIELDGKLVNDAFDEIVNKIRYVQAGIDEFTNAEKMLFQLFISHAHFYM